MEELLPPESGRVLSVPLAASLMLLWEEVRNGSGVLDELVERGIVQR